MNAKEAKALTDKVLEDRRIEAERIEQAVREADIQQIISSMMLLIKEEANNGSYSCWRYSSSPYAELAMQRLEEMGYRCTIQENDDGDTVYTVSWDHDTGGYFSV